MRVDLGHTQAPTVAGQNLAFLEVLGYFWIFSDINSCWWLFFGTGKDTSQKKTRCSQKWCNRNKVPSTNPHTQSWGQKVIIHRLTLMRDVKVIRLLLKLPHSFGHYQIFSNILGYFGRISIPLATGTAIANCQHCLKDICHTNATTLRDDFLIHKIGSVEILKILKYINPLRNKMPQKWGIVVSQWQF